MQYVPAITMAFSISRNVEAVNSAVRLGKPIERPERALQYVSKCQLRFPRISSSRRTVLLH